MFSPFYIPLSNASLREAYARFKHTVLGLLIPLTLEKSRKGIPYYSPSSQNLQSAAFSEKGSPVYFICRQDRGNSL